MTQFGPYELLFITINSYNSSHTFSITESDKDFTSGRSHSLARKDFHKEHWPIDQSKNQLIKITFYLWQVFEQFNQTT